ncbi:hypothetical protein ACFL47_09605 [Candidatus Latescibacterota bacterium]
MSLIIIAGCGDTKIVSRWCDRDITIDGDETEWGNFIQHYDQHTGVSICMFNDSNHLYIKLSTTNTATWRLIMGQGFTVWFYPDGGEEKVLGINFPIGLMGDIPPMATSTGRYRKPVSKEDKDRLSDVMAKLQSKLEIITPETGEFITVSPEEIENSGFNVKLGTTDDTLVYELKVPLGRNEVFGINAPGKTIDIGFETNEFNDNIKDNTAKNTKDKIEVDRPKFDGLNRGRPRRNTGSIGYMTPKPVNVRAMVVLAENQEKSH